MSTLAPDQVGAAGPQAAEATAPAETVAAPESGNIKSAGDRAEATATERKQASLVLVCSAGLLSVAAAAWMCASIFSGVAPKLVAFGATVYGVSAVALSYRTRRPDVVQYLALLGAAAAGALLMAPDATGGSANLPGLIAEAIRTGGIANPPIPFDPGWKFILAFVIGAVGIGAVAVAYELNRPKLAVLVPAPVIFAGLLVQPPDAGMTTTLVALVLGVGALAVAYGADLATEGTTSSQFETRRFLRGAGVATVMVAMLVGIGQLGFLFPDPVDAQVIPPQRPTPPPPTQDRELFTVRTTEGAAPLRLGTLDVYQDNAWMTPPFDERRLMDVPADRALVVSTPERIPGAPVAPVLGASDSDGKPMTATFRITDIEGRVIPALANTQQIRTTAEVEYDPRTQSLRLAGRARAGTEYTVDAPVPPGAQDLATAGPPPPSFAEFLGVPDPPREVRQLLTRAPKEQFARLQFVRNEFYKNVVAAGAGDPVDVPPSRVAEMLAGAEATPFEITAGEALLARWAGTPSRIGYGYYRGDPVDGVENLFSIRPRHGASWLEAYFDGYGWVPIVGTPPRARSSLSESDKREDPTVRPTDEFALTVYVPVKEQNIVLLFTLVRYWVFKVLPWLVAAGLLWTLYPAGLKSARRARRRRWAAARDPAASLAVAYAEWRDVTSDFNIGHHAMLPLEFVDAFAPDPEHRELAWLVTRGLWGDLRRDLRDEDVVAAEEMAASLRARLRKSQPGFFVLLAFVSRASLRDPFTTEMPNLWPQLHLRRRLRSAGSRLRASTLRAPRLRPQAATSLIIVFGLLLGGCARTVDLSTESDLRVLPEQLVPARLGTVTFTRDEPAEKLYAKGGREALVSGGRVFTIANGEETEGSLQIAVFKPSLRERRREVKAGVLESIGGGRFKVTKIAGERIYQLRLAEQQMFLSFSPDGRYYELMVTRSSFEQAGRLFADVLAFQKGGRSTGDVPPPADPRRGSAE